MVLPRSPKWLKQRKRRQKVSALVTEKVNATNEDVDTRDKIKHLEQKVSALVGARDKSQDTGDKDTEDYNIFFKFMTSRKTKTTKFIH